MSQPLYPASSGYYSSDPYYGSGYYEPYYYGSGYYGSRHQERVYYYPYPVYRDRPYPVYRDPPDRGHDHHDGPGHGDSHGGGHSSGKRPEPSRPAPIERRPPRDPGPSVSGTSRPPAKPPAKPVKPQKDNEPDGISRMLRDRVVRKER